MIKRDTVHGIPLTPDEVAISVSRLLGCNELHPAWSGDETTINYIHHYMRCFCVRIVLADDRS